VSEVENLGKEGEIEERKKWIGRGEEGGVDGGVDA
jgi:hypothetical protein